MLYWYLAVLLEDSQFKNKHYQYILKIETYEVAGPCYILVAKPTGSRSSISLCYVKYRLISSHWSRKQHPPLARAPAGISHLSSPKPTPPLAAFPSSSLLPMTVTNCKNRDISPSLTLSVSCQSSLPIAAAAHSPFCFYLLFFALLHTSISTSTSSSAHLSLQC